MGTQGSKVQTLASNKDPSTLAGTDGIDVSPGGWFRSHVSAAAGEATLNPGGNMVAYGLVVANPDATGQPNASSDLRWMRLPGADWVPSGGQRDEVAPNDYQVQAGVRRIVMLPLGVTDTGAASSYAVGHHFRRNRA